VNIAAFLPINDQKATPENLVSGFLIFHLLRTTTENLDPLLIHQPLHLDDFNMNPSFAVGCNLLKLK